MKLNIKSKEFLTLLAAGAVVLIVGVLLVNNRFQIKPTGQKKTVSITTDVQVEDYFDEKTGRFVSPVIEIEMGEKKRFVLDLPSGWQFKSIHPQEFSNGDYSIIIRDEYEGFNCLFNTQGSDTRALSAVDLNHYSDIDISLGSFKVGTQTINAEVEKSTQFIFCRLYDNPVTGQREWISGSEVGLITFKTPVEYDEKIVGEMIEIINSIRVIEL